MSTVRVKLGTRSYDVIVSAGLLAEAGQRVKPLAGLGQVAVITTKRIGSLHGSAVRSSLEAAGLRAHWIEIADGERSKSLTVAGKIYDRLTAARVARDAVLVALGGGVVGDLAGFVAATYLRGLSYVQIPTTLVAQVDSAIGGKTGVNHREAKNIIGAFYQPGLVLVDPNVLRTLPPRQLRAGLGEVIKYSLLAGGEFVADLQRHLPAISRGDLTGLQSMIERCCAFKAAVVAEDELDIGRRAILNYGHTIGHALETVGGYRRFLHGEAIAVGMHGAALIGRELGWLDQQDVDLHVQLLAAAGLPVGFTGLDPAAVSVPLRLDKKRQEGKLRFVLLDGIGQPAVREVAPALAGQVIEMLADS